MENKENKYLGRLQDLYERIDIWMQVGPACTEYEWTKAEEAKEDVDELIRLILANEDYKVPAYRLKYCNRYWKKYDKLSKVQGLFGQIAHDIANE